MRAFQIISACVENALGIHHHHVFGGKTGRNQNSYNRDIGGAGSDQSDSYFFCLLLPTIFSALISPAKVTVAVPC